MKKKVEELYDYVDDVLTRDVMSEETHNYLRKICDKLEEILYD